MPFSARRLRTFDSSYSMIVTRSSFIERTEHDDVVEAVDELGPEELLDLAHERPSRIFS
jgi:hypothetical protein